MKNTLICFLFLFISNYVLGQNAYIQVSGEAGLSVYLNSQFKGKTTVELNGLIVENVTPGINLIKILKDGYTAFEENITVKPGEVFAYKVKPFTKHVVSISEQGNSGETDKKTKVETGKLIIQSVPIEIKVTIPQIEGITDMLKTKDKWSADQIPEGFYDITFTFNEKTITKKIEITAKDTTIVFINMINGSFESTNHKFKPLNLTANWVVVASNSDYYMGSGVEIQHSGNTISLKITRDNENGFATLVSEDDDYLIFKGRYTARYRYTHKYQTSLQAYYGAGAYNTETLRTERTWENTEYKYDKNAQTITFGFPLANVDNDGDVTQASGQRSITVKRN